MIYSYIPPEAESSSYRPDELLTFVIPIEQGKTLKKGSLFCAGSLEVSKTGGVVVEADKLLYDGNAGIHAFFKNISTTYTDIEGNDNLIENVSYYNRFAKMYFEASRDYQNQCLSNFDTMELRTGVDAYTQKVLYGQLNDAGANSGLNSFAFAPLICCNRTMDDINGGRCSKVKIGLTLQSLSVPLFTSDGSAKPAGLSWVLKDLKMHYVLEDAPVSNAPVQMMKTFNVKRDIVSSDSNFNYNPPGVINAFSASFLSSDTTTNDNQLATDTLKDLQRLEYTINGVDSYIKFPLLNESEIILNYISSLGNLKQSNAIYSNLTEKGYGVGLKLMSGINMTNSKFSVNLQCGQGRTLNYGMYAYFQCMDSF